MPTLQTQWGLCRYKSTSQAVQCLDYSLGKWTIWLHFWHETIKKNTSYSKKSDIITEIQYLLSWTVLGLAEIVLTFFTASCKQLMLRGVGASKVVALHWLVEHESVSWKKWKTSFFFFPTYLCLKLSSIYQTVFVLIHEFSHFCVSNSYPLPWHRTGRSK